LRARRKKKSNARKQGGVYETHPFYFRLISQEIKTEGLFFGVSFFINLIENKKDGQEKYQIQNFISISTNE